MNVKGVWVSSDNKMFEVTKHKGAVAEFEKFADGTFHIEIDGYQKESIYINAEQFAALKQWIMEN